MPTKATPPVEAPSPIILNEYICARCEYVYHKAFDFEPYMCYRCMRFIAKRTWITIKTITPPARTERPEL